MSKKAKFAVEIIKQYAKENQVPERSTSDLSKFEEWLIIQLFLVKTLNLQRVTQQREPLIDFITIVKRKHLLSFNSIDNKYLVTEYLKSINCG